MKNDTIEQISNFLFINKSWQDLKEYDLVIILGNNFYQESADIIEKLKQENKINRTTKIIISGNKGFLNKDIEKTEAELILEKIEEKKLNIDCIIEPIATNIKENLEYSKKLVDNLLHYKRILLIGKSFASRRILMCADALDYPLEKVDIYGIEVDVCKSTWHKNEKSRNRILNELIRIGEYTLKNDLKL